VSPYGNINASFNGVVSANWGQRGEQRMPVIRNRKSKNYVNPGEMSPQSHRGSQASVVRHGSVRASNAEIRAHNQDVSSKVQGSSERMMYLVLIVMMISVVLAAFTQGFCRSMAEDKSNTTPSPVCLPIYNIGFPFDWMVLFVCYVCIGLSCVALPAAFFNAQP
jgi:hypothetical protein